MSLFLVVYPRNVRVRVRGDRGRGRGAVVGGLWMCLGLMAALLFAPQAFHRSISASQCPAATGCSIGAYLRFFFACLDACFRRPSSFSLGPWTPFCLTVAWRSRSNLP